ncbi:MAG: hypothetical protein ACRC33_02775 [Gemmataceae bacterium]
MPRRPSPDDVVSADGATVEAVVCAAVRGGAYPHVAAAACGVDPGVFDTWLGHDGRGGKYGARLKRFQRAVAKAAAFARMKAEHAVFADDPKTWLRSGPGRETGGAAGWSGLVKPVLQSAAVVNVLASPEWNSLWATMLATLGQFPEARAALLEALAAAGEAGGPRRPKALPVVVDAVPAEPPMPPPDEERSAGPDGWADMFPAAAVPMDGAAGRSAGPD